MNGIITGHNNFQYKVHASWGDLPPKVYPVKDCHEMVISIPQWHSNCTYPLLLERI